MASAVLNAEYMNDFIECCGSLIRRSDRLKNTQDPAVIGDLCRRFETTRQVVGRLLSSRDGHFSPDTLKHLSSLLQNVSGIYEFWLEKSRSVSHFSSATTQQLQQGCRSESQLEYSGQRGRPKITVDLAKVQILRDLGFSWKKICQKSGVSASTMKRRVSKEPSLQTKFTEITEEALENTVREIKDQFPRCGERIVIGMLRARGIRVQRERVRTIIRRIDPIGTTLRWFDAHERVPYNVPASNCLWHIYRRKLKVETLGPCNSLLCRWIFSSYSIPVLH